MARNKYTLESLKEFAEGKNGKLLSEKYVKASDFYEWKCSESYEFKMRWGCENHHRWYTSWSNVKYGGTWCS